MKSLKKRTHKILVTCLFAFLGILLFLAILSDDSTHKLFFDEKNYLAHEMQTYYKNRKKYIDGNCHRYDKYIADINKQMSAIANDREALSEWEGTSKSLNKLKDITAKVGVCEGVVATQVYADLSEFGLYDQAKQFKDIIIMQSDNGNHPISSYICGVGPMKGFDKEEVLNGCRNLITFPYEPRRVLDIPYEDGEVGIKDAVTCAVAQTESLFYNYPVAFAVTKEIESDDIREKCERQMIDLYNKYRR